MSSLEAIRDAIKATIGTAIPALSAYDTVPGAVNLPALVVVPDLAEFEQTMGRGTDRIEFDLAVLVSFGEADIGQDALDDFVTGAGLKSVRQAIFNNRTLGLPDTSAHVARMSDYGAQFEMSKIEHIGAKLRLIVYTDGRA